LTQGQSATPVANAAPTEPVTLLERRCRSSRTCSVERAGHGRRARRTSHAAISARELGIPAILGCEDATKKLRARQELTGSCAEGELVLIFDGLHPFDIEESASRSHILALEHSMKTGRFVDHAIIRGSRSRAQFRGGV